VIRADVARPDTAQSEASPTTEGANASPAPRCKARSRRQGGGPCQAYPVLGAAVCVTHGGATQRVKRAAVKRLARQEWAKSFGAPVADTDPTQAVLDQLSWTAGHVVWLRERVQATDPEALVWGVTSEADKRAGQYPGVDVTSAAKVSVWLELYGQERDRLLRMCEVAHRMGIEDRRVALAERVGGLMADLLRGVLDDLDLTDDQRRAAALAVPRHLALVAGALGEPPA
jgi:hypothetical protein